MLGNSTIIYICDTQHLNIICIILYFNIFTFLALLPLQHICYYFNKPTVPLDPHVVYFLQMYNKFFVLMTNKPQLFTVVLLLHRILHQQYGQMLRLRHLLTQRWVQFIDNHTCLLRRVPLDPHVVYCLRIYNEFVVLTTNKPQLFAFVNLLHLILRQ